MNEALPGMSAAIDAATAFGRVQFKHADPAGWWRECMAAVDAVAEAIVENEAAPAVLVARADAALRELLDLAGRNVRPGKDVLAAICAAAPAGRDTLERLGREGLPLLAAAAAALRREIEAAMSRPGAEPAAPLTRRMVQYLAEQFAEAFVDRDGEPARASHGDDRAKGSPFGRFLDAVLGAHAREWADRRGFPSPIQPGAITTKMIRGAIATHDDGGGWTAAPGPARRRRGRARVVEAADDRP